MSDERQGAAYWLWENQQEVERSIERCTAEIESLERHIVEARTRRDRLRLTAVEMQAARSIIEKSGLRVEMRDGQAHVSIDPVE